MRTRETKENAQINDVILSSASARVAERVLGLQANSTAQTSNQCKRMRREGKCYNDVEVAEMIHSRVHHVIVGRLAGRTNGCKHKSPHALDFATSIKRGKPRIEAKSRQKYDGFVRCLHTRIDSDCLCTIGNVDAAKLNHQVISTAAQTQPTR